MRPLTHPVISDVPLESILHALSDPVRVEIFADIEKQHSPENCSTFLTVGDKQIPKSTLSHHFKVLREAGLIRSERRGAEMMNYSRCKEVDQRFPGLITSIIRAHEIQASKKHRR